MHIITTATASYRLPRENGQPSQVLRLKFDGRFAVMTGGKYGMHVVETTDLDRVKAHWAGYVFNTRGRAIKPRLAYKDVIR